MLELLEQSEHHLSSFYNIDDYDDDVALLSSKFQLGILCALVLSSRMMRIRGLWEEVLWKIVSLVDFWRHDNTGVNICSSLESTTLKFWTLTMFTDTELCPNPYLRLEMLRIIGTWPQSYFDDVASGMQAAAGLVNTCIYMDPDHLIPNKSFKSLFLYLTRVLQKLGKYGHLGSVTAAAVDQVKRLKIGPEAVLFNHLAQLFKQTAEVIQARYHEDALSLSFSVELLQVLNEILLLYWILVDMPPTMAAYGVPGLAQAAAVSLVTITSSVVAVCSTTKCETDSKFLTSKLDYVYKIISVKEELTLLSQILRLNHTQKLSSLNKQSTDSGFTFHYFPEPCQESFEEFPENFTDSVTQAVMEAPVLLHSSKMIIDEATLVQLLLESPSDPFTRCPLDPGSYSRLPDLQAAILAWRQEHQ